jgi:hypothetical protein
VLASASDDTTVVLWDVERALRGRRAPRKELSDKELASLWGDLGGDDAARAYRAIHALSTAGGRAVPWLGERLRPARPPVGPERMARLLRDLDADEFRVREGAARELEKLGAWARPCLREALKGRPSPEFQRRVEELLRKVEEQEEREPVPKDPALLRALEALEQIGTREARRVLTELAEGAMEGRLRQEAKAAVARLAKRAAGDR